MLEPLVRNYRAKIRLTPEGEGFVFAHARSISVIGADIQPEINVGLNWLEELKARVPVL